MATAAAGGSGPCRGPLSACAYRYTAGGAGRHRTRARAATGRAARRSCRPLIRLRADPARIRASSLRPVSAPLFTRGPRVGAMVDYTPAEASMQRMIVIRNLLGTLHILFKSGIAPSTASYYSVLHLAQFTDAYDGPMGHLTARQKRLVQCVTDLISGAAVHKKALKDMRNNWIAHLQDDGEFAEDAPDFVRRVGMPGDSAAHYEMHVYVIAFVDIVGDLLPEIAAPTVKKFNRTGNATPKYHFVDLNRVASDVSSWIEVARKRVEREFPETERNSLLGATGVHLDPLGLGGPGACTARVDKQCKGGAKRQ